MARQEVGRRVARELRVVGQRDRRRIHHHQAQREQRHDDPDQRLVEAEQARRAGPAETLTQSRTGTRSRAASPRPASARRRAAAQRRPSARRPPSHAATPASCGQRLHRGDEDLGPVRVVAEHVEARAGRAQQHGVAGLAPARRPSASRLRGVAWRCSGTPRACQRRLDRRRVAADQRHRARMARAPARPAARSPGPCRRRRGSRRARRRAVGAQAVQRGDRGADIGALAVVEGLDAVDAGD